MAKFSAAYQVSVKQLLRKLVRNLASKTVKFGSDYVTFTRLATSFAIDFKGENYKRSIEMPAEEFFKIAPDDNETVSSVICRIH
ncbi:MAG: hypothetical protein IIT83_07440 [Bacteroidales bacterium]|nr:hypothetical protein [Bacteroidales bacterium]